ncbi:MAG: hypothetical protein JRI52_08335, partial [Deltaproteobacteria bacterium]|nr:hypothetical protein [Deltaproteobacteria bacterium]
PWWKETVGKNADFLYRIFQAFSKEQIETGQPGKGYDGDDDQEEEGEVDEIELTFEEKEKILREKWKMWITLFRDKLGLFVNSVLEWFTSKEAFKLVKILSTAPHEKSKFYGIEIKLLQHPRFFRYILAYDLDFMVKPSREEKRAERYNFVTNMNIRNFQLQRYKQYQDSQWHLLEIINFFRSDDRRIFIFLTNLIDEDGRFNRDITVPKNFMVFQTKIIEGRVKYIRKYMVNPTLRKCQEEDCYFDIGKKSSGVHVMGMRYIDIKKLFGTKGFRWLKDNKIVKMVLEERRFQEKVSDVFILRHIIDAHKKFKWKILFPSPFNRVFNKIRNLLIKYTEKRFWTQIRTNPRRFLPLNSQADKDDRLNIIKTLLDGIKDLNFVIPINMIRKLFRLLSMVTSLIEIHDYPVTYHQDITEFANVGEIPRVDYNMEIFDILFEEIIPRFLKKMRKSPYYNKLIVPACTALTTNFCSNWLKLHSVFEVGLVVVEERDLKKLALSDFGDKLALPCIKYLRALRGAMSDPIRIGENEFFNPVYDLLLNTTGPVVQGQFSPLACDVLHSLILKHHVLGKLVDEGVIKFPKRALAKFRQDLIDSDFTHVFADRLTNWGIYGRGSFIFYNLPITRKIVEQRENDRLDLRKNIIRLANKMSAESTELRQMVKRTLGREDDISEEAIDAMANRDFDYSSLWQDIKRVLYPFVVKSWKQYIVRKYGHVKNREYLRNAVTEELIRYFAKVDWNYFFTNYIERI